MDILTLISEEGKRRNLSESTISTYCSCVDNFLRKIKKEPRKITKKDIKDYIDYLLSKGSSGSTINVYVNALKFMLQEILAKRVLIKVKYSKTPKTLPIFLTKEEVIKLIDSINNEKHKLMIELMYSAGLRVSEVVNLRVKDADLENSVGWVRLGKGKKDRLFIISDRIKQKLKEQIKNLEYESFIFEGRNNTHMSRRSIQQIVRKAAKKAGIKKKVHPHTLRHSFATHLIENGYDVASVQSLLGHNSSQTTMVYIHMASPNLINVQSPYDSI